VRDNVHNGSVFLIVSFGFGFYIGKPFDLILF
jgi:hypothetical protein